MRAASILAVLALTLAMPASAALAPGARAPDFATKGAMAGKVFNLRLSQQLKRGPVVLYFFPAAFTSGCNAEAKAFADAVVDFKAAGATVIGMSADAIPQLQKFSTELCAGKFAVATATPAMLKGYDVELKRPGGAAISNRTSYVIGQDGRIAFAHSDMSPVDHVRTTLAAVRKLKAAR
ncbi:redoxin domain-containing protein [Sphingomonas sp. S1-29]|uniref:peroxiredoxin n=1 Tax=Sphingomonas sp. S1-29 TaxID=2991074 RepID=UPI00223FA130|nr:redoxin domain-containing protein [Sphingomonas sp. S1-29]UZK69082.1 redoxin domain-containing protein [Sphingomonas sp. S1-29]